MPVCGRLPEGGARGLIRGGLSLAASGYQSHKIVAWIEPDAGFTPAAMNDEPQTPPGQALALARFALIAKIQDLLRQGFPLSLALEQVSICPLTLPDGSERVVALRTLEDWWYDYQHGGFAGLVPKTRVDKGQVRMLSPEQQKWILEKAQAHLGIPVKVLYRRWKEQDPKLASL